MTEPRMSSRERKEWRLATGAPIESVKDLKDWSKANKKAIVEKGFTPKPPEEYPDSEVEKDIEAHRKERFSMEGAVDESEKLFPLDDKVVVEQDVEKDMTDGGIILPDQAKKKLTRGTVVAVGPGKRLSFKHGRETMAVSRGDRVIYSKYSGHEVEMGKKTLMVLSEGDILSVIASTNGKAH